MKDGVYGMKHGMHIIIQNVERKPRLRDILVIIALFQNISYDVTLN